MESKIKHFKYNDFFVSIPSDWVNDVKNYKKKLKESCNPIINKFNELFDYKVVAYPQGDKSQIFEIAKYKKSLKSSKEFKDKCREFSDMFKFFKKEKEKLINKDNLAIFEMIYIDEKKIKMQKNIYCFLTSKKNIYFISFLCPEKIFNIFIKKNKAIISSVVVN